MNTKHIYLGLLTLYFVVLVGTTIFEVGRVIECGHAVYSWNLPFTVAGIILIPAVLGFLAGREKQ